MSRIESLIVSLFIAVLVPVLLFFAAWWLSVGVVPDSWIPICAFGGLILGIVLDAIFLRAWVAGAYRMNVLQLSILYLYVSVVTYTVFMGVPVFNLVPGIIAGIYAGRRLRHSTAGGEVPEDDGSASAETPSEPGTARGASAVEREAVRRGIRGTGLFTAAVVACASAVTAFLVLREPTIGSELEHMFALKFTITRPIMIALIGVGAPALVLAQYWLTAKAARIAYGARGNVERPTR
jgi:hypothetical protein